LFSIDIRIHLKMQGLPIKRTKRKKNEG